MSYLNLEDLAYRSGKSKEELLEEIARQLSKETGRDYDSCYRELRWYLTPTGQEGYHPSQNSYQDAFYAIGAKYDPENYGIKSLEGKIKSVDIGKRGQSSSFGVFKFFFLFLIGAAVLYYIRWAFFSD
jgi:hypothetical protein